MRQKSSSVKFELAEDVKKLIEMLVTELNLQHIKSDRIFCVRSNQSKARAYARIWGLSRIFQVAAGYKPTYVIEVLSEHFDHLTDEKKLEYSFTSSFTYRKHFQEHFSLIMADTIRLMTLRSINSFRNSNWNKRTSLIFHQHSSLANHMAVESQAKNANTDCESDSQFETLV